MQSGKGVIKVSVKDAAGAAVPGAEVTLLVVDKAILDLMPYALQVDVIGGLAGTLYAVGMQQSGLLVL
jgi:hypothetical protein